MSEKSRNIMTVKQQNLEIMIVKLPGPLAETDKYGYKKLLSKLNEWARCPKDNCFLVWKDEKKETMVCPKCGFEKPAEPAPTWP